MNKYKKQLIVPSIILFVSLMIIVFCIIFPIPFMKPLYIRIPFGILYFAGSIYYCFIFVSSFHSVPIKGKREPASLMYFGKPCFNHWFMNTAVSFSMIFSFGTEIIEDLFLECGVYGFFSFLYTVLLIILCGIIGFLSYIVSPLILLLFSAIHLLLVLVGVLIVWIPTLVFHVIDLAYMKLNRLSSVCAVCHAHITLPNYSCPNCSAIHKKLAPNCYGILHHQCECETKLPSSIFSGRFQLEARCPDCGQILDGSKARRLSFQLVGAKDVGKTAFMAAFVHSFKKLVEDKGTATISNPKFYWENLVQAEHWYQGDSISPTSGDNAIAYPVHVSGGLRVDRQVAIYDIGGDAFDGNLRNDKYQQKQFAFCNGFVFLLDLTKNENNHSTQTEQENVATALINAFVGNGYIKVSDRINTPLAIVISKADQPPLFKEFGVKAVSDKVTALIMNNPGKYPDEQSARDDVFREYLEDHGYSSLIKNLEMKFVQVHYFAASAIGHAPNGKPFVPFGVMEAVEWMLIAADPTFSNTVLKLLPEQETKKQTAASGIK